MSQPLPSDSEFENEPVIDALLEECLGGKTPPDLTDEILRKLEVGTATSKNAFVSTRRTRHAVRYRSHRSRRSLQQWCAAVLVIGITSIAGYAIWRGTANTKFVANPNTQQTESIANQGDGVEKTSNQNDSDFATESQASSVGRNLANNSTSGISADAIADSPSSPDSQPSVPNERSTDLPDSIARLFTNQRLQSAVASTDQNVVRFVDDFFRQLWKDRGVEPAKPFDDRDWLNMAYTRILGRTPTNDEIESYVRSKNRDKRAKLIATLVNSPAYENEFADYWDDVLSECLLDDAESQKVLAMAVRHNRPYNETLSELLIRTRADVSMVCKNVLGVRLDCAKCHEDQSISQNQAHEVYTEIVRRLQPDQRRKFTELAVASDRPYAAFVNRIWRHFYGHSLTPESDPSSSTAALQPVMNRLVQEFAATNFDTKKLIRWVASSLPFTLSDEITPSRGTIDSIAGEPLFSRRYASRSFATSIDESLAKVAQSSINLLQAGADPIETIGSRAPKLDAKDVVKPKDPKFWSVIAYMNRDPDRPNLLIKNGAILQRLANANISPREKVEHIFLIATGDKPTPNQLRSAERILEAYPSDQVLGLRDIWWAVLKGQG